MNKTIDLPIKCVRVSPYSCSYPEEAEYNVQKKASSITVNKWGKTFLHIES